MWAGETFRNVSLYCIRIRRPDLVATDDPNDPSQVYAYLQRRPRSVPFLGPWKNKFRLYTPRDPLLYVRCTVRENCLKWLRCAGRGCFSAFSEGLIFFITVTSWWDFKQISKRYFQQNLLKVKDTFSNFAESKRYFQQTLLKVKDTFSKLCWK